MNSEEVLWYIINTFIGLKTNSRIVFLSINVLIIYQEISLLFVGKVCPLFLFFIFLIFRNFFVCFKKKMLYKITIFSNKDGDNLTEHFLFIVSPHECSAFLSLL